MNNIISYNIINLIKKFNYDAATNNCTNSSIISSLKYILMYYTDMQIVYCNKKHKPVLQTTILI